MEKIKTIYKKYYDNGGFIINFGIIFFSFTFGIAYYHDNFCHKNYYKTTCQRCIGWHTETNDMTGKYHREWEVCDGYEYYECEDYTLDCGCTKIQPHQ